MSEGEAAAPPPEPGVLRRRLALLLLAALVLGLYAPAAGFGFIHDDRQLILRQVRPASWVEVARVFGEPHWPGLPYYRPVSRATMVGQKYLHGDAPAPFHRFNIVLLAATALVFFAILRRPPFRVGFAPAWLATALFAAHPVASHVVYPICSGRETLIPSFLMLCAIGAWLSPGVLAWVTALLFSTLSIFAKEQAAVLPGIFVLADWLRVSADSPAAGRGLGAARWLRRYAPLVVLFALYFVVRSQLFGAPLHAVAVFDRPEGPLLTLLYTLQTAIVPFVDLVFEPRLEVWWSWPRVGIGVAVAAALAFAVARSGGPRARQAAFLAGWWLLALLPTANLLVQEAAFAERYGFLSLAALVALAALALSDAWERPGWRPALGAAALAAVALLGWISFDRGPHFASEESFAEQWVRSDPRSYKARLNRGQTAVESGDWERAAEDLAVAAELRPRSAIIRQGLAHALWREGDVDAAAEQYARVVRMAPDLAEARLHYGDLLLSRGDVEAAAEQLRAAVRGLPRDARARLLWGRALRRQGSLEEARQQLARAVQLDPRGTEALYELGLVLEAQGRTGEALERYRAVLARNPEHVRAGRRVARLSASEPEAGR